MIRHSFTAFSALTALLFCGVARADATTEARDAYDEAHEPVIYLDNSTTARLMRAIDRWLARVMP